MADQHPRSLGDVGECPDCVRQVRTREGRSTCPDCDEDLRNFVVFRE